MRCPRIFFLGLAEREILEQLPLTAPMLALGSSALKIAHTEHSAQLSVIGSQNWRLVM